MVGFYTTSLVCRCGGGGGGRGGLELDTIGFFWRMHHHQDQTGFDGVRGREGKQGFCTLGCSGMDAGAPRDLRLISSL